MVHAPFVKPPPPPLIPPMQPMKTGTWSSRFATLEATEARQSRPAANAARYRDGTLRPDRPRPARLHTGAVSLPTDEQLRASFTDDRGRIVPAFMPSYHLAKREAVPPWVNPDQKDPRLFRSVSNEHFPHPMVNVRPGSALPPRCARFSGAARHMQSDVDEVVFGRDIDKSNEAVLHAYVPLKWPPRVVNPEAPLTEAERQELSALEASLRQERELTTKVADQLYAKQAVRWEREEYRMLRDV